MPTILHAIRSVVDYSCYFSIHAILKTLCCGHSPVFAEFKKIMINLKGDFMPTILCQMRSYKLIDYFHVVGLAKHRG